MYWYSEEKAYVGFWKNNKQHGSGKFFSGTRLRLGKWDNGVKGSQYQTQEEFENELDENEKPFLNLFRLNLTELGKIIEKFQ